MLYLGLLDLIRIDNALARAANDRLMATGLERDPRYLGSISASA